MELNFEMLEPETSSRFEPLPEGWYSAIIYETEERVSAAGHKYLNVTFEITSADNAGRRVWTIYNLNHPDATPKARAERECSDLARALGFAKTPADSDEMKNLHLDMHVKIKEGTGGYGPKNEVNGYNAAPSPNPPVATTAPLPKAANGDLDGPDW